MLLSPCPLDSFCTSTPCAGAHFCVSCCTTQPGSCRLKTATAVAAAQSALQS
jgi:hypothetical protein